MYYILLSTDWMSSTLHLGLDLVAQLLEFVLAHLLLWPTDSQSFLLIRLRDHVEVDVVDDLMCQTTIVLQDIVVLGPGCLGDLLGH